MTSFSVAIEPPAQARLAALLMLTHLLAAASPWFARCPPMLALPLSLLSMAGLLASLSRLPGPHCVLQGLQLDGDGCQVRLLRQDAALPAMLGPGTRAYAAFVVLDVIVAERRLGWLLPRGSLPPDDFRRLKTLVRLT